MPPAGQAPLALPGAPRRGAPADAAPQPGDEVVAEPPSQKILNKSAQFSGLDKITGRIINFDAGVGETVQFGALQVTTRACYTRPPTETANTDAFIEIDEVTLQGEIKRIFTGWMFASSPGLHAVEHPIYDVWLTDCKNPLVVAAPVEPAPAPAPPPKPAAPRRPAQRPRPTPRPRRRGAERTTCCGLPNRHYDCRHYDARWARASAPLTGCSSPSAVKSPSPMSAASSSL